MLKLSPRLLVGLQHATSAHAELRLHSAMGVTPVRMPGAWPSRTSIKRLGRFTGQQRGPDSRLRIWYQVTANFSCESNDQRQLPHQSQHSRVELSRASSGRLPASGTLHKTGLTHASRGCITAPRRAVNILRASRAPGARGQKEAGSEGDCHERTGTLSMEAHRLARLKVPRSSKRTPWLRITVCASRRTSSRR
jgi:hypothetical protein